MQLTFVEADGLGQHKRTRREIFLMEMDHTVGSLLYKSEYRAGEREFHGWPHMTTDAPFGRWPVANRRLWIAESDDAFGPGSARFGRCSATRAGVGPVFRVLGGGMS